MSTLPCRPETGTRNRTRLAGRLFSVKGDDIGYAREGGADQVTFDFIPQDRPHPMSGGGVDVGAIDDGICRVQITGPSEGRSAAFACHDGASGLSFTIPEGGFAAEAGAANTKCDMSSDIAGSGTLEITADATTCDVRTRQKIRTSTCKPWDTFQFGILLWRTAAKTFEIVPHKAASCATELFVRPVPFLVWE